MMIRTPAPRFFMNEKILVWQKKFNAANLAGRTMLPGSMAILFFFLIARVLMAPYAVKSALKVILFLGVPYICLRLDQFDIKQKLVRLFHVKKKERPILLHLLLIGSGIILMSNLFAGPLITAFGIAGIMAEIKARAHTAPLVFISALIYIPLVNALVEELFFRGFLFMHVYEQGYHRAAMLGSAFLFMLYHLTMFHRWFPWPVLILILAALFLAGILLNHLLLMWKRIAMVWALHGLANLAILLLAWRVF